MIKAYPKLAQQVHQLLKTAQIPFEPHLESELIILAPHHLLSIIDFKQLNHTKLTPQTLAHLILHDALDNYQTWLQLTHFDQSQTTFHQLKDMQKDLQWFQAQCHTLQEMPS